MHVRASVCVNAHMHANVCMRECARACVHARVCMLANLENCAKRY